VTDAKLAVAQHVQDAQAGPIRKSSEHGIDAVDSFGFHIRVGKYSGWQQNRQAARSLSAMDRIEGGRCL